MDDEKIVITLKISGMSDKEIAEYLRNLADHTEARGVEFSCNNRNILDPKGNKIGETDLYPRRPIEYLQVVD